MDSERASVPVKDVAIGATVWHQGSEYRVSCAFKNKVCLTPSPPRRGIREEPLVVGSTVTVNTDACNVLSPL